MTETLREHLQRISKLKRTLSLTEAAARATRLAAVRDKRWPKKGTK